MMKNELRIKLLQLTVDFKPTVSDQVYIANADEAVKVMKMLHANGYPSVYLERPVIVKRLQYGDREIKHAIISPTTTGYDLWIFSTKEPVIDYHLMGKFYGYPDCCIKSFIANQHKERVWKRLFPGSGYVNCIQCSEKDPSVVLDEIMTARRATTQFNGTRDSASWVDVLYYYTFEYDRVVTGE